MHGGCTKPNGESDVSQLLQSHANKYHSRFNGLCADHERTVCLGASPVVLCRIVLFTCCKLIAVSKYRWVSDFFAQLLFERSIEGKRLVYGVYQLSKQFDEIVFWIGQNSCFKSIWINVLLKLSKKLLLLQINEEYLIKATENPPHFPFEHKRHFVRLMAARPGDCHLKYIFELIRLTWFIEFFAKVYISLAKKEIVEFFFRLVISVFMILIYLLIFPAGLNVACLRHAVSKSAISLAFPLTEAIFDLFFLLFSLYPFSMNLRLIIPCKTLDPSYASVYDNYNPFLATFNTETKEEKIVDDAYYTQTVIFQLLFDIGLLTPLALMRDRYFSVCKPAEYITMTFRATKHVLKVFFKVMLHVQVLKYTSHDLRPEHWIIKLCISQKIKNK